MKRFYKDVSLRSEPHGHAILLDGRSIKTPAKAVLLLPTRALADAVATEWTMQGETIEPKSMPFTRHANTVIDRITAQREAVVAEIARYGGSDVICYHASGPADLVAQQLEAWTPLLEWSQQHLAAPLHATAGITAVAQPDTSLAALASAVMAHTDWQLAALYDAVTISGSLVIGLALSQGRLAVDDAWRAGHIDELFQVERWGEDSLAAAARQDKRAALDVAARLFHLLTLN
jgi:chaperone required for assembly of F1-ATPase